MRGTSVLIVDDEEGLRHGLENLFEREGFTVHTAASYESAVSAAARSIRRTSSTRELCLRDAPTAWRASTPAKRTPPSE